MTVTVEPDCSMVTRSDGRGGLNEPDDFLKS